MASLPLPATQQCPLAGLLVSVFRRLLLFGWAFVVALASVDASTTAQGSSGDGASG